MLQQQGYTDIREEGDRQSYSNRDRQILGRGEIERATSTGIDRF